MDTCLVLTEIDLAGGEDGLRKAKQFLRRFSFTEQQNEAYRETIGSNAQHWSEFLQTAGTREDLSGSLNEPFRWLRLAGGIEIEETDHSIQLFLYPVSRTSAAVSVLFSSTVYGAIYSFRPSYEGIINTGLKQDLVSLLLLLAVSFSTPALGLYPLTNAEDLIAPLRLSDIRDWLTAPTPDAIRRWPFLIVGIRSEIVDRRQAEKQWPAERLVQSGSGFVVYDAIYAPE
jgi:hypothetical protein